MISKEAIEEFKYLYKKQYGEELSDYVASEAANRLVHIVGLVYKPISKEDAEKLEERRKNTGQKQEELKESEKIDLVKHFVAEAKFNERRAITKDC